jgi:beta-glucosidase
MTWPRHIEDTPSHPNWSGGGDDIIRYEEGIFLGYRYFDQHSSPKPLFPFGFGLSYTTFGNVKIHVQEPATLGVRSDLKVSCAVTNIGSVAGKVVLQIYIKRTLSATDGADGSKFSRPVKELKAFRKVSLGPGASSEVECNFDKYAVSCYDAEFSCWRVEKGTYEVLVGFSAEEIVASAKFQVSTGFTWNGL